MTTLTMLDLEELFDLEITKILKSLLNVPLIY